MTGNQSGQGWRMTTTTRVEQHRKEAIRSSGILERMNIEETYQRLLMFYRPGCHSVPAVWRLHFAALARILIAICDTTRPHDSCAQANDLDASQLFSSSHAVVAI